VPKKRVGKLVTPDWILEGRKAVLIYDILAAAYEENCDCLTCQLIRQNISFLERIFKPRPLPGER